MKNRRTWRAVWAALLCVALLGGMLGAAAEEEIELAADAVVEDAVEDALDLEVGDAPVDLVDEFPDLALNDALTLDGALAESADDDAIELVDDVQANDEAAESAESEASEDAVPLVATYTGDDLTKVYDCNKYGAYVKDGETVYVIEALKTIKSAFSLAPAEGYDWVEGHEDVSFKLKLSKQFSAADAGSYEFTFTLELSGDNAGYYTLPTATVTVPATITPRNVTVTPRAGLYKTYGASDPVYPSNSWLSSDETSPLHQDVSGVAGYGIPVNTVDGKLKLTITDAAYILKDAKDHGEKFFRNDGWLSRKAGEAAGKYRITRGNLDFGPNFTITVAKEYFTITPREITDSGITMGSVADKTYTASAIKPSPVVRYEGKKLKKGTDYTLKYSANKNPGRATITFTGKGNFTGSRKVTFKIVLKPTTVSKLTAGKGKVTVTWKKGSKNTGYQIAYSLKSSFASQVKKKVSGIKKTSLTVKSLKSGKTYYFRIRTYKTVNGKTYWSAWSKSKKIKVK